MSDNFINSLGIYKGEKDFSIWTMASDYDVPNNQPVNSGGVTPNLLPFSELLYGTLPGMAAGIFTVPVNGFYAISFYSFGTDVDNGVGTRTCQIVIQDSNENGISPNQFVPAVNLSSPKFGDTFIGHLTEGFKVITGLVQNSGADYKMDVNKTAISILKLFDITI